MKKEKNEKDSGSKQIPITSMFKANKKESLSKMSEEIQSSQEDSFEEFPTTKKKKTSSMISDYESEFSDGVMFDENQIQKFRSHSNLKNTLPETIEYIKEESDYSDDQNGDPSSQKRKREKKDDSFREKYFIFSNGFWQCKTCSKEDLKKTFSATTSLTILKRHLKKCHPERESQPKIKAFYNEKRNKAFSEEKCLDDLTKFFISARLPFTFVENEEFLMFLSNYTQFLPEEYQNHVLPKRKPLSETIQTKYNIEKLKLKNIIKKNKSLFSLTVDGWTSKNFEPFLGITCK